MLFTRLEPQFPIIVMESVGTYFDKAELPCRVSVTEISPCEILLHSTYSFEH